MVHSSTVAFVRPSAISIPTGLDMDEIKGWHIGSSRIIRREALMYVETDALTRDLCADQQSKDSPAIGSL